MLRAQTSETLHVRVRLSRYPGGEYTMRRASPLVVNCTADGLFFSAEGDDVAAFFSTTVRWSAPLLAGCVAAEVDGLVALEARKAAPGWWTRLLGGAPTASNTPTSSAARRRAARVLGRWRMRRPARMRSALCRHARAAKGGGRRDRGRR